MRNVINTIFLIFIVLLLFVLLWEDISPNTVIERVGASFCKPEFPRLPLGCNGSGRDYAVIISNAFRYNLMLSGISTIAFLLTGITLGVAMGFSENVKLHKGFRFANLTQLLKRSSFLINEFLQSIPLLIILIISVLFFQRHVSEPGNRLLFTLIVMGVFSAPKLAVPLHGIIKYLRQEEFILAAKATGISRWNLIFRHILYYEGRALIILQTINFLLFSIMMEVFLSFFGKGANPDLHSLGNLILHYSQSLRTIMTGGSHIVLKIAPFVLVIILCLTIRWIGQRVIIISGD